MLGTQRLHQGSHFVVIVSRHRGEKMVFNLEVEMSTEPIIEGGLVDIACCLELGGDPVPVPAVINVHRDMVHLCHPHKPVAFQKPDHEEKAQEALHSQQRHISEGDADVEGDHPGQVHPLLPLDNKIENIPLEVERQQGWGPNQEEVFVLVVVRHVPFLLFPKLHREDLPQGKKEGVHVDVWVFAEAVGLGMVLEVHVVPPTGRGPLQVANHKMM